MAGATDDEDVPSDVATSGGIGAALGRRLLPGVVRRRYAAKFLLSLLLVVLVIAVVGGISYAQIQSIIQEDAENTLESTATLQADSIAEWTAGMRTQTLAVASANVYADGTADRIRTHLSASLSVASDDVVAMHYVNRTSGRIVVSTDAAVEDDRVSAVSPGLESPVERLPTTSGEEVTVTMSDTAYERNGHLRMAFASYVQTGDGVVVVVGDVRRDFEQLHETRNVVTTRVLNAAGKGLLTPRRNNPSDVTDTAAFQAALGGNTTTLHRDPEVVAFAPVPNTDWVVATTAPKSDLFRASRAVGRNVVALVTISLVALGIVGVVLGHQTVPPLVRLRERAEAMEDGHLDVELSSAREDEIGRLFHAFASMRDALREQIRAAETAREEAEASRRELERQNERLDQFASTVSHDLRNPLTVARGNLELVAALLEDLGDDVDPELGGVRDRIETIEGSHERIETIIDDVLALARRGDSIESTTPSDLGTVAREAWGTVETDGASLTVAETATVEADREQLRRALENLFRNATEHVGPAVSVEIGLTPDGFYVADDGPGIPAGAVDDVFEYGHSGSDDGTGLGLAIVETIASAHGWTVAVDESYDRGARFAFSDVSSRDNDR